MSKITPIMHLKFDGNANDSSGNNNHGTVYGATLTEDRFGNPNSAYSFDGSGDVISVGTPSLQIKTLNIWLKPNVSLAEFPFSNGGYYTDAGISLYIGGDNKYSFHVCDGTSRVSNEGIEIYAGRYDMLTLSLHDDIFNVYRNGKLVSEIENTLNSISFPHEMIIGGYFSKNDFYFDGTIDDIRIYNQALTPTQVKYLYDTTKRKYGRQ
jgi:hypothetical protein